MIASKTRPELYLVIERREDMLSCKHSFPAKATIICQTLKNLSLKLIPELTVTSELNMITGSQATGLRSSQTDRIRANRANNLKLYRKCH